MFPCTLPAMQEANGRSLGVGLLWSSTGNNHPLLQRRCMKPRRAWLQKRELHVYLPACLCGCCEAAWLQRLLLHGCLIYTQGRERDPRVSWRRTCLGQRLVLLPPPLLGRTMIPFPNLPQTLLRTHSSPCLQGQPLCPFLPQRSPCKQPTKPTANAPAPRFGDHC